MATKTSVPEQVLNNLRCSFCTEYLSVPPIYIYPDRETFITCGRCPMISDQNPVRNVPYETLAALLTYPCRYKASGCLELLSTDKVQLHESECAYRQFFCPMMPLGTCPWQGASVELLPHYLQCHNVYVLQQLSLEIDLVNKYEENYLFDQGQALFVLQTRYDIVEQSLQIFVRCIGTKSNTNKYSFTATLCKISSPNQVPLGPADVGDDSDMTIDAVGAAKISVEEVMIALDNPAQVICSLAIVKKEIVGDPVIVLEESFDSISICSVSDEKILRKLECPACFEHMIPPIHQCSVGHSICATCRPSLEICPICKGGIGNTRNYILEDLAEDISYPCKYQDYDCTFTSNHGLIKKHEAECKFGPYECPLKNSSQCAWKGKLTNLMDHVRGCHEDNVLDFEEINTCFSESCLDDDCRITLVYENVFKIDYKYENGFFYWSVQLVGPAAECTGYSYELDFTATGGKERTYFKRICHPFAKENVFADGKAFLKVPVELIRNCTEDDELFYKCLIRLN